MFNWIRQKLLTIFGKIKVSRYPMWLSYSPSSYKVRGKQFREVISLIKPGYVIGRGYDDYLDGYFIPGNYSHTCICTTCNANEQYIVHAMSQGVFQQDLIDFLRCDRIVIFKPKKDLIKAVKIAKSKIGAEYDFNFKLNNNSYYCHELVATCYPDLNIPTSRSYGRDVYTIQSFIDSPDFEIVYEFDPKHEKQGLIK